jgi:hypothetical protein
MGPTRFLRLGLLLPLSLKSEVLATASIPLQICAKKLSGVVRLSDVLPYCRRRREETAKVIMGLTMRQTLT